MKQLLVILAAIGLVMQWQIVSAAYESKGQPPLLVELYTSEGCSSCPPADARIAQLLDRDDLWQGIVPMAFHVDYWDYIGWKDGFAKSEYGQRQREFKAQGRTKAVYTPGWLVDGQEWRGFFRNRPMPAPVIRDGGELRADLNGNNVNVQFNPPIKVNLAATTLHMVVMGFDYQTDVKRGENRGLKLEHQFVVLDKQQQAGGKRWQLTLPDSVMNDKDRRKALVVWVTSTNQLLPVQVTGGWL